MLLRSGRVVLWLIIFIVATALYRRYTTSTSSNPQYFQDISFRTHSRHFGANNHVDVRFAPNRQLSIPETRATLRTLLTTFSDFMRARALDFWIAHGTLLGWYWNEKMLPWDTDVDIQVPVEALQTLVQGSAMFFNMTAAGRSRRYLLDINPYTLNNLALDPANTIDARWIDTANAKFIDITAIHSQMDQAGETPMLYCKDGHEYHNSSVFPLVAGTLEGITVNVPRQPGKILQQEYGRRALTKTQFHW